MYDFLIVGGGVVGLSTAMALGRSYPEARIAVLEKETDWAFHQTGHNSGVIHSGVYYTPGSLKAKLCREGNRSLVAFCREHGIAHEVCGKVIVATEAQELPQLEKLYQRGLQNGLEVRLISAAEVQAIEPYVRCLQGIWISTTGIVDYRQVCRKYAEIVVHQGGELHLGTCVQNIDPTSTGYRIETPQRVYETRFLINCAGLQSDRLARLEQVDPGARIVPFRGEYYELRPEKRYLVHGLIYPVPNPNFPFLGVHFTRMIDGSVHAGPNAVLSFKREGYRKTDFDLRDFADVITYPGFWRLVARYPQAGLEEWIRSLSKAVFLKSLQRLIPDVQAEDLIPCAPGVRAQALKPNGKLVDDFLLVQGQNSIHVCNAPSPAATASLEIGQAIVAQLPEPSKRQVYLNV